MTLRPLIPATITALLVAGLASGQTPSTNQHDHGATATPQTAPNEKAQQPLTLGGCVVRQKDAASGYLLVEAHPLSHHRNLSGMSAPLADQHAAHATPPPESTPAKTGTTAAQTAPSKEQVADSVMFTLRGLPPEQLAKLNGKHVMVEGQIDTTTVIDDSKQRPGADRKAPTFIATSIEPVDGACPKR